MSKVTKLKDESKVIKTTIAISAAKPEIVIKINKEMMVYHPREDITAYELSLLVPFIHCCIVGAIFDRGAYVDKHKLLRHFIPEIGYNEEY